MNIRLQHCIVLIIIHNYFPYRLTALPARENMFPLDPAPPVESHCLWLTMLIKHEHSTNIFPPSYRIREVTMVSSKPP